MITRAGRRESTWSSAHLYFTGALHGSRGDQVITEIAVPFGEAAMTRGDAIRYFVVRFGDPEPHIRLRLDVIQGADGAIMDDLRSMRRTSLVRAMKVIPYEPEMDRYGGPAAMDVAEWVFLASSRAANGLLMTIPSGRVGTRFGRGAIAMIVLLHALYRRPREAAQFLERYSAGYAQQIAHGEGAYQKLQSAFVSHSGHQLETLQAYVNDVWSRAESGESLTAVYDEYHSQLGEARVGLEGLVAEGRVLVRARPFSSLARALDYIAPSYLHMMNNRLGVAVLDEAYLASILSRALVTLGNREETQRCPE